MMKRKKLLRVLKTVIFFTLLLSSIALISRIVERKASIIKFKPFLDAPEDIDVLFIGDSHVVNGVFPMELWHDYGIASYNLSSYGNTLPVSYWMMMNALDYADPKLVVIGVKDVEKGYKLSGSSSDVHTAFDCFPLTQTKLRAIEDLMDDPYAEDDAGNRYMDMRWEYCFTLGKYHARWSELTPSDFHYELNCQKGAEMAVRVAEPRDYDIIDENQALEESGWGFIYLRRMIEECRSRHIDVLLVHLPYPAAEEEQMAANAVYYIAEEYDLNYIDFVNLDQVVDYDVDCYDPFSHLNPSGARKVTDYLGRYIAGHYDIADRRGDASHQGWTADYDAYTQYKLGHIRAQNRLDNLLMLLHDDSFSVCISLREGSAIYRDAKLMTLMHNIVREHIFEEDAFSKWSNTLFPLEELDEAAAQDEAYFLLVDRKNGAIQECAGSSAAMDDETSFGTLSYRAQDGGISLTIDRDGTVTHCFADVPEDARPDAQILVVDDRTGHIAAELYF